jgi:NAD(P)-dependent dehydrogenase (short-subunit alcohol dehydrogenase family)
MNAELAGSASASNTNDSADSQNKTRAVAGRVVPMVMDTSDFASVDAFVARFVSAYERLDHLLLNAGIGFGPRHVSTAGLELIFHTNHVGHFQVRVIDELLQQPNATA